MINKEQVIFLSFTTGGGSVSDYFTELSNKLSEVYSVIVISQGNYVPDKLNNNINLFFWPSKRPTKFKDFIFLSKLIIKYKPFLIISLFGSVNINMICSFIFKVKYRVAWIRTLSTQFPQKPHLVLRKRIIYKLSNLIISNSKATAQDASKIYHIKPNKIKVLPNSVKDYIEYYSYVKKNKNKFIYVGRLHKSKGVDILVRAFKKVLEKNNDIKLYIIGNGPELRNLRNLSKHLDLKENQIIFLGTLKKTRVLKEMKSSYSTIVPSNSEAFGFTVIEAMSMKTCVIGANNTGIKEIINHNKTGLLFQTGNDEDLAVKINLVIKNNELRNKLALGGYEHFKSNYCVDVAVNRDFDFFDKKIRNNS